MTKISGTIKEITERQDFGTQGFYKRDLIVETDEKYPQTLCLEFHKEASDHLDTLAEGEVVDVSINIRGKKWESPQGETKYFVTLVGWRIEKAGNPIPQNPQIPQEPLPGEEDNSLPY